MNLLLELKHYRLVEALSRNGSLISCASELLLTPSALSHQLREIERRLGYRVVERNGSTLSLNEAGLRLLDTARDIIPKVQRAEEDCNLIAKGLTANLVISTESQRFFRRLPQAIETFREVHPEIDLSISISGNRKPVSSLRNGLIDMTIISTVFVEYPVEKHILYEEDWVVILSPEHPSSQNSYFDIEQFASENLIAYATDAENNYVLRELILAQGVTPARTTRVEVTEGIIELVKANYGVAVMAEHMCQREIDDGKLAALRLTENGIKRSWSVVCRAEDSRVPHIRLFLDHLVELFRDLPSQFSSRINPTSGDPSKLP